MKRFEKNGSVSSLKRLAYYVTFLGWFLLFVYVFAFTEYLETKDSVNEFLNFFVSFDSAGIKFRALVFFTPFITSLIGYFIYQISTLYEKTSHTEKMLENALTEWRATFDNMPNGVMLVDENDNIVRVNGWMSKMFGYPIKTLLTKKSSEIIRPSARLDEYDKRSLLKKDVTLSGFEYKDESLKKIFRVETLPLVIDNVSLFLYSIVDITELKENEDRLAASNAALDAAYEELKSVFDGLIFAFADALDAKSPWTRGHSERVKDYAVAIGIEMGLSGDDIEILRPAALLHDIGKIGTYDVIIDKPGKLTEEEYGLIKLHPATGAKLLGHIKHFQNVVPPIKHHHERIDGKGYPDGLKDKDIPLLARILCVADSFDAMTADRPYRKSAGKDFAIAQMKRNSGTQFDPDAVDAFIKILGRKPDIFKG